MSYSIQQKNGLLISMLCIQTCHGLVQCGQVYRLMGLQYFLGTTIRDYTQRKRADDTERCHTDVWDSANSFGGDQAPAHHWAAFLRSM